MRAAQVEVGRELQVQRDAGALAVLEDGDVVGLLDERLRQGDREHAVAQVQAAAAWLDVHDDVAPGQRLLDGLLDAIGGAMALDHRLSGRDRDDDVGEVAAGRLAQAQAAQLDVGAEFGDRPLGGGAGLGRACGPSARSRSR